MRVMHRRRTKARQVLTWGAVSFALLQLAAVGLLEWKRPDFFDPKYGCRLTQLRARFTPTPGRRLVVVLGTSRAEQGFRPGLLAASQSERGPLVFNLARGGSSPLLHLVTLRRLLADGVRPDWVLLEIFPPSLVEERAGATLPKTTLRDFPVLCHYPVSRETYADFFRDRALLWHTYRSSLLDRYALAGLAPRGWWVERLWDRRGGEWQAISDGVTPQERRALTADARRRYFHKLENFRIAAGADGALRALLDLCREQGIGVVLFLMPESSEFRSWYPPVARERLSAYLASLRRDYDTPLIDARDWIPDDDFWDGHHLLRNGAAAFTQRFAAEVLSPLIEEQRGSIAGEGSSRAHKLAACGYDTSAGH
jgi:hypothetical protein